MKKNRPGKIPQCNLRLIDGRENRGQACRQGRVATSKPPLNNQLPVGRKVIGRVRDNSPASWTRYQNKYGS